MLKHRAISVASVLGLAGASVFVAAAGPVAAAVPTDCTTAPFNTFFDVSSPRDHHDDVAMGTPGEDVGVGTEPNRVLMKDAGTVTIAYGDPAGTGAFGPYDGKSISMSDLGFGSKTGDKFGASVLVTDLNGDSCGDLVVGAPGRNSGSGVVIVIYGQPQGEFTSLVQVLKQGTGGVGGSPEAGDGFGSSLAVTGDNTPGNPKQLWVGVPGEDLGATKDAGMVHVFPTSTAVPAKILPTSGITSRQQGKNGLSSTPEAGDRFGASLAGSATTMLVGVPGEDVGTKKDAGMFHAVVKGTASNFTAENAGVPGASETGDQLGSSLAIMDSCDGTDEAWAIGAPLEDVGSAANAGNVVLLDRGAGAALTLQQDAAGLTGKPESGDHFGASLNATGTTNRAKPFLAIGDPLEDVGSTRDAGFVTTLTTSCPGGVLTTESVTDWTQDGAVPGEVAQDNRFGASLGAALVVEGTPAAGTLHYRLLISVPWQDEETLDGPLKDSGMVLALPAAASGFTLTGSTFFGQATDDLPGDGQKDDHFGSALDSANASR